MAAVSEETRRLQKALRARDKWQKKCEFEREVRRLRCACQRLRMS